MRRTTMAWSPVCALLLACNAPPPAEGPGTGAVAPPVAHADQEVLIATVPEGADVLLSGAKVGVTPFKMLVRGNTNVLIEKTGYVRQAVLITPESEPNLVVELVADPSTAGAEATGEGADDGEDDGEDEEAAKNAARKTPKAKTGGGETEPPAGETAQPEPEPAAPVAKAKSKVYETMAELKRDLRAGLITSADYRRWQQDIREKRAAELTQLKQDLAAGKLTKAEYETRARQIKIKYEGR